MNFVMTLSLTKRIMDKSESQDRVFTSDKLNRMRHSTTPKDETMMDKHTLNSKQETSSNVRL